MYYADLKKEDLVEHEKMARDIFLREDFCDAQYYLDRWDRLKCYWLMNDRKERVGFLVIEYGARVNPNGMHLLEMGIFEKYQNSTYAAYLLKLFFDETKGYVKSASINPRNDRSIRLAEKCGFKYVEDEKCWLLYKCPAEHYPLFLKRFDMKKALPLVND